MLATDTHINTDYIVKKKNTSKPEHWKEYSQIQKDALVFQQKTEERNGLSVIFNFF